MFILKWVLQERHKIVGEKHSVDFPDKSPEPLMAFFKDVVDKTVIVRDLEVKHVPQKHNFCFQPFLSICFLVDVHTDLIGRVQNF